MYEMTKRSDPEAATPDGACVTCCIEYACDHVQDMVAFLNEDEVAHVAQALHSAKLAKDFLLAARTQIVAATDRPGWLPPVVCCGAMARYHWERQ